MTAPSDPTADPTAPPNLVLRIPPPVWALAFVLIAAGIDKLFDWTFVATIKSVPLAVVLAAGGLALMGWGVWTFRKAGTEIMPTSPANAKLVSEGPFQLTRNPMYAGLTLLTLGIALYMGTLPFFAVPVAVFMLARSIFIPYEEAKMERQYGQAFVDYKARVGRWF